MFINNQNLSREQLKDIAFTEAELMELETARNLPVTFDEDCPETTPERAVRFQRVNPPREGKQFET